jgi:hypothetical protein
MVVFLFYHRADLDGYAGGYILKNYLINKKKEEWNVTDETFNINNRDNIKSLVSKDNTLFIRPYNYDDDINIDEIEQVINMKHSVIVDIDGDERPIVLIHEVKAYFVDCSPHEKNNYFKKLYSLLKDNLIIIDHHKSSMDFISDFEIENNVVISGVRMTKYSGCELASLYIRRHNYEDDEDGYDETAYENVNTWIKLIGRYDVWDEENKKYDWNNEILPFQYWMRSQINLKDLINTDKMLFYKLSNVPFPDLAFNPIYGSILEQGKAIIKYITGRNKSIFIRNGHQTAVEFLLKETDSIVVYKGGNWFPSSAYWVTDYQNNSLLFSDNGEYTNPEIVYMVISQNIFDNYYNISIYSIPDSTIDVSEIARHMRGGGHKHAAGFKADVVKYDKSTNTLTLRKIVSKEE